MRPPDYLFIIFIILVIVSAGEPSQGRAPGAFPPSDFSLPTVTTEIIRIASERHQKGLMHPMIYQLLTQVQEDVFPRLLYVSVEFMPSYAFAVTQ